MKHQSFFNSAAGQAKNSQSFCTGTMVRRTMENSVKFYGYLKDKKVFCPQCGKQYLSPKGLYRAKTFTCTVCGVEVLR